MHKNAFKRILKRYIRIGFNSGGVWCWFGTSAAVPGPFPGYPRRAVLFDSSFARSCRAAGLHRLPGGGLFLIGWRFPGWSRDGAENTKEMYDKLEAASKPGRFELGKSEKNRRNLKLIQTCDFFILCILYINSYNVPWRDVNFYFITFNSSFPVVFFLLVISEILFLRLFCRLVSLLLRFADSLLIVPMPTPF